MNIHNIGYNVPVICLYLSAL